TDASTRCWWTDWWSRRMTGGSRCPVSTDPAEIGGRMVQTLEMVLDDTAAAAVRQLRGRLVDAGVPAAAGYAHVTLAAAGVIPAAARRAVREELGVLAVPDLYLHTLGTCAAPDDVLRPGAV